MKKIRDYAFVHFTTREACVEAMQKIDGSKIDEAQVEVTLAKPVDKNDHNRMAKVGAKVLAQGVSGNGELGVTLPTIVSFSFGFEIKVFNLQILENKLC